MLVNFFILKKLLFISFKMLQSKKEGAGRDKLINQEQPHGSVQKLGADRI